MLYFDSCVYETEVLEALVKRVGADRVVLGSTTRSASRSRSSCGVVCADGAEREKIIG